MTTPDMYLSRSNRKAVRQISRIKVIMAPRSSASNDPKSATLTSCLHSINKAKIECSSQLLITCVGTRMQVRDRRPYTSLPRQPTNYPPRTTRARATKLSSTRRQKTPQQACYHRSSRQECSSSTLLLLLLLLSPPPKSTSNNRPPRKRCPRSTPAAACTIICTTSRT